MSLKVLFSVANYHLFKRTFMEEENLALVAKQYLSDF